MPGTFTTAPVHIIPPTQTNPTALKQVANEIVSKARGSNDPQLLELIGRAISSVDSAINPIMSALRSPVPQSETVSITDAAGNLIGWIGYAVSNGQSFAGAWFKTIYIGGTDPSTAKFIADVNGDVTSSGKIVLTGSTAIITLDPSGGGFITVSSVSTSLITRIDATGFFISSWDGVSPAQPSLSATNTTLALFDAAGNQIRLDISNLPPSITLVPAGSFPNLIANTGALTYTDAIAQTAVLSVNGITPALTLTPAGALQIKTLLDGNGISLTRSLDLLRTAILPGDLSLYNGVGGLVIDLSIAVGFIMNGLTVVTTTGVVSSSNGFTGTSTPGTGTVTTVAGIVVGMT